MNIFSFYHFINDQGDTEERGGTTRTGNILYEQGRDINFVL